MRPSAAWRFIADNVVSLTAVFVGVAAIILTSLGVVSQAVTTGAILGIVTLFAGAQLIENRNRIAKIQEQLERLPEQLSGANIEVLPDVDAVLDYLILRTKEATTCIDQASIDFQRTRSSKKRREYNEVRDRTIKKDEMKYRYIGRLDGERRLSLAQRFIIDRKCNKFFAAYYLDLPDNVPLLNFVIFDKQEVITRHPFEHGHDTIYLLIRNRQVASLFTGYFDQLWEKAEKADSAMSVQALRQRLLQAE